MRLDHIAYRTADRNKTALFFMNSFGYKTQEEFSITLGDGSKAECIALEPPERITSFDSWFATRHNMHFSDTDKGLKCDPSTEYHLAPEIFVSDGPPGSLIDEWVQHRDGVGGIHHLAYMVDSVEDIMKEWKEKGYAEFLSEEPLNCKEEDPELHQVFTKPSELTGVIYEFIQRGKHGFCKANVSKLMDSTKEYK
jgi:catechol 2,3-dioxygenase-like lactoylglutathione lyase family enzyme